MEHAVRRRRLIIIVALAAFFALLWKLWPHSDQVGELAYRPPDSRLENAVQVLNATDTRRLALAATRTLRSAGFDVVALGNGEPRDSTVILVRRGSADFGSRIAARLGVGTVVAQPDSLALVAATVILGPDYQPPPSIIP